MSDIQSVWNYYTKRDGSYTYNLKCNLCGCFLQQSSMIIHVQKSHSIQVKEKNVQKIENNTEQLDQDLVRIGLNNILNSLGGYVRGLNLPLPKENINDKVKIEDDEKEKLVMDDLSMENIQNSIKIVLDENIALRQQVGNLTSELAAFKALHKNCMPIKPPKNNKLSLRSSNSKSHIIDNLVHENKKFKHDPKKESNKPIIIGGNSSAKLHKHVHEGKKAKNIFSCDAKTALMFLQNVKKRFLNQPQMYQDFLTLLKKIKDDPNSHDVHNKAAFMIKDYPELSKEFKIYFPLEYSKIEPIFEPKSEPKIEAKTDYQPQSINNLKMVNYICEIKRKNPSLKAEEIQEKLQNSRENLGEFPTLSFINTILEKLGHEKSVNDFTKKQEMDDEEIMPTILCDMCEQRFMELPLLESHILNVHLKNKSSTNNSDCKTEINEQFESDQLEGKNEVSRQNITIDSVGVIQSKIKRELEIDHPILDTNSKNHQEKYVIEKRLKTSNKMRIKEEMKVDNSHQSISMQDQVNVGHELIQDSKFDKCQECGIRMELKIHLVWCKFALSSNTENKN